MSPDNRIPVTHVGSLIRPPALVEYLAAMETGESSGGSALAAADAALYQAKLLGRNRISNNNQQSAVPPKSGP